MEEVREQYKRRKDEKERKMVGRKIVSDAADGSNGKTAFDALMRSKPGSSLQRSPAKLTKGKRGRPKGSVSKNKKMASRKVGQDDASTHVDEMSHEEQPLEISNDHQPNQESGVDREVFDALPDELKEEVRDQMKSRPLASTSKRALFEESESNSRASETSLRGERAVLHSVDIETTAESTQEMDLEKGDSKRVPTFCGETKLSKLRPLLKSWLASAPLPKEDDVQMLGNFLKDLVIAWKLDMAHVVLKCLHRLGV